MDVNDKENVLVATTRSDDERSDVADVCVRTLGIEIPALVDGSDDRLVRAYTAWPYLLYVIARDGRIAYKSAAGPFGFKPEEVEAVLRRIVPHASPHSGT